MKKIMLFLLVLSAIIFTGCIRTETKIFVKNDGSGYMEIESSIAKSLVEMMKSMGQFDDSAEKEDFENPYSKEYFEKMISIFGEVSLDHYSEINNDRGIGGKVKYKFSDITKVKASFLVVDEPEKQKSDDSIKFDFIKEGASSKLVIKLPPFEESSEKINPDEVVMMKMMFKDMFIKFDIEVEKKIKNTNAGNKKNKLVNLISFDISKVLDNDEKLINVIEGFTSKEKINEVNKNDGIYFEPESEVYIEF